MTGIAFPFIYCSAGTQLILYMHFFGLMQPTFVNGTCPGKSWKKEFLSPGKPWNLVFASTGKSWRKAF